jgi:WD40 repeat protein
LKEILSITPKPNQGGKLGQRVNSSAGVLAWSSDGKRLTLSIRDDGAGFDLRPDKVIEIWEISTGKQVHRLEGHSRPVLALAWSPDGQWLASGSEGGTIKIWNQSTGKEERTLKGDSRPVPVKSVAWSHNGRRLFSAGGQEFKVWDTATWQQILSLPFGSGPVNWCPNGECLALLHYRSSFPNAEEPTTILDGTPFPGQDERQGAGKRP